MREMYHNEAELSPTSPDFNIESITGGDPFYDRFPWFRMVGRFVFFKIIIIILEKNYYEKLYFNNSLRKKSYLINENIFISLWIFFFFIKRNIN